RDDRGQRHGGQGRPAFGEVHPRQGAGHERLRGPQVGAAAALGNPGRRPRGTLLPGAAGELGSCTRQTAPDLRRRILSREGGRMLLQGQTRIVTGASRGIGRAVALELAAAGANVVVNYRSNRDQAEAVVRAIVEKGGIACAHAADVTRREEVRALVAEAQENWPGSLAVVVNNAGITADRTFRKMDEAQWRHVL